MIVLDASVLIGHLDGRDPHHARARQLLEESDAEPLGASAITLVDGAQTGTIDYSSAAITLTSESTTASFSLP